MVKTFLVGLGSCDCIAFVPNHARPACQANHGAPGDPPGIQAPTLEEAAKATARVLNKLKNMCPGARVVLMPIVHRMRPTGRQCPPDFEEVSVGLSISYLNYVCN